MPTHSSTLSQLVEGEHAGLLRLLQEHAWITMSESDEGGIRYAINLPRSLLHTRVGVRLFGDPIPTRKRPQPKAPALEVWWSPAGQYDREVSVIITENDSEQENIKRIRCWLAKVERQLLRGIWSSRAAS